MKYCVCMKMICVMAGLGIAESGTRRIEFWNVLWQDENGF